MREILFRGKRIDNGEWVYGLLVIQSGEWLNKDEKATDEYLIYGKRGEIYLVDSSTVGQYTGLTDKNGKKIFEGDIVSDGGFSGIVVFDDKDDGAFLVIDPFVLAIDPFAVDTDGEFFSGLIDREVVGNIHDDPELSEIVDES